MKVKISQSFMSQDMTKYVFSTTTITGMKGTSGTLNKIKN